MPTPAEIKDLDLTQPLHASEVESYIRTKQFTEQQAKDFVEVLKEELRNRLLCREYQDSRAKYLKEEYEAMYQSLVSLYMRWPNNKIDAKGDYICPITNTAIPAGEEMVIATTGCVYDKKALLDYHRGRRLAPPDASGKESNDPILFQDDMKTIADAWEVPERQSFLSKIFSRKLETFGALIAGVMLGALLFTFGVAFPYLAIPALVAIPMIYAYREQTISDNNWIDKNGYKNVIYNDFTFGHAREKSLKELANSRVYPEKAVRLEQRFQSREPEEVKGEVKHAQSAPSIPASPSSRGFYAPQADARNDDEGHHERKTPGPERKL